MSILATVRLFEAKGHVSAHLDGRHGYGPTPAAALRDLAATLEKISGIQTFAASCGHAMPAQYQKEAV
jgi:hypothetical protein